MGLGYEPIGFSQVGAYGGDDPWYSLGEFNLRIEALYGVYSLKVSVDIPEVGATTNWKRRLRILRKQDEWATGPFDADANVFLDQVYEGDGTVSYLDDDLANGQIYYYSMYELRDDDVWIHDVEEGRVSAYPYSQWGFGEYMYSSLPRGWKAVDSDGTGDLRNFVSLTGAIFDGVKSDIDHLLTLFSATDINEELLPLLDLKIGWPTWYNTNGLQKRSETLGAVDLYKIRGKRGAYLQMLEEVFEWNVNLVEGWRYVMFSNGKYGSTTPDMDNIEAIRINLGTADDLLKYVNDTIGWHGYTGLGIFLTEVEGVSSEINAEAMDRAAFLMEWGKASFINFEFGIHPLVDSDITLGVLEEWNDFAYGFLTRGAIEEDVGASTPDATLFESNTASDITTNAGFRTYHGELSYA